MATMKNIVKFFARYFRATLASAETDSSEPRFRRVSVTSNGALWAMVDFANDSVVLAVGPDDGDPEKIVDAGLISDYLRQDDGDSGFAGMGCQMRA
jgi:hypothetical protein